MTPKIHIPQAQIEALCHRNRVRRLALFGSVLRDDFGPQSDVDILVEFQPGTTMGLRFFGLQEELTALIGRPVDLNTPGFISPYFREEVLANAEDVYVAEG